MADYGYEKHGVYGCLDGFCHITGTRTGMHTNGGCHCTEVRTNTQDRRRNIEKALKALRERVEYLESK